MKKLFLGLMALAFVLVSVGCASNTVVSDSNTKNNKKQSDQKLRFDDWKYMGFGEEIPDWFEFAVAGKIDKAEKALPELSDKEVVVISSRGANCDQAENSVRITIQELGSEYSYYNDFWARFANEKEAEDKPYVSVYIYYK